MFGVVLVLLALGLYIYGIRGYRREPYERRYLWAVVVGIVLDWAGTMLMPTATGISAHAVVGWVALGLMTILSIGAGWELIRWRNTWGDWLVIKCGYPFLSVWALALVLGLFAALPKA